MNFTDRVVAICGTWYAGEIKKSVFTILNYLLPEKNILPMHASANIGPEGRRGDLLRLVRHRQDDAVGRSVAHADRRRRARLGRETALFNFEGGCYAKVIKLSREAEPEIYATTERFGTVLENVVHRSGDRRARSRRRPAHREHARLLSDRLHSQHLGERASPPRPTTSSC